MRLRLLLLARLLFLLGPWPFGPVLTGLELPGLWSLLLAAPSGILSSFFSFVHAAPPIRPYYTIFFSYVISILSFYKVFRRMPVAACIAGCPAD